MSASEFNPYLPPAAGYSSGSAATEPGAGYYRDGEFLMVRDGAKLPEFCPLTGIPALPEWGPPRWEKMTWTPLWLLRTANLTKWSLLCVPLVSEKVFHQTVEGFEPLAIFVGFLVIDEIPTRLSKVFVIRASLPPTPVVGKAGPRDWFSGAIYFGLIVLLGSDGYRIWWYAAIGVFGLLVSMLPRRRPGLRPAALREGWYRIEGCSPVFLDLLPSGPG